MFKYLVLLFSVLLLSFSIMGQNFKRHIGWPNKTLKAKSGTINVKDTRGKLPFLTFDNAVYPDPQTMLPYYFELIRLDNNISNLNQIFVAVDNQLFQPLERDSDIPIDIESVNNQRDAFFSVDISRKVSYLQVTIPAVRINPVTGEIEKLVSFDINVRSRNTASLPKYNAVVKNESVLASGSWTKVKVSQTGIHRISYSEIQAMGFTDFDNISVWGHGGRQLPFLNNQISYDDLTQIPVWIERGSDNVFNQGDYILFYAEGPLTWSYNSLTSSFTHKLHDYTQSIYYFLTTSQPPLWVITSNSDGLSSNYITSSYDALTYFERNDTNLIKSGRQWFGESFDVYTTRSYSTGFSRPVPGGNARITVSPAARSSVSNSFTIKANGNTLGTISLPSVSISNEYADFVSQKEQVFSMSYTNGELDLELTFNKPTPAAKGWLDYIRVMARQQLYYDGKQFQFRDVLSAINGRVTTFNVSNAQSALMVWDVTNLFETKNLSLNIQGNSASFTLKTDVLREFVAFTPDQVHSIEVVGTVPNQNIHGASQPEMVIVVHPEFLPYAQELADLHAQNTGIGCLVVTTDEVFNEFSSGAPDVSAIRNMMRMFYKRSTSDQDMPKYLLLFGDGSYDNISQRNDNSNFIPTFQSLNGINKQFSFVTDDYFGLLDDNEGEADGLLDIGIGRIPCSTTDEANVALEKIRQYLSPSSNGSWHNQLCFIGDDEDGNLHMRQADELARLVETNYPGYNIEKIFFDAFPQISTTQGNRYPEVNNAINNRANQGALIMNYTGHANAVWMSEEKVLMVSDILSWRNFERLPLFVTATCEFSRFDDFSRKSAGEYILFSNAGGGVGLISTTRVVYASSNHVLNMNFYRNVFEEMPAAKSSAQKANPYYPLGEVLRLTKISSGSGYNKRSFMLLGDPALTLHYPSYDLAVTAINSVPVGGSIDTLKALSKVTLQGEVTGLEKNITFSGEAEITLYDKMKEVTTLANDGGTPLVFNTRENVIYRGRSSIDNGAFEASFIIPKDIVYNFGTGRFSLFASDDLKTGSGYFEDFIVGGISGNMGSDIVGPEIEIYLNDKNFVSGGIADINPKLIVYLADSSGINTTGTGIGHDLVATLIGESETSFVLNDYYVADLNSFQKGKVEYQLADLNPGHYTIKIKAWDVYNNSSEYSIDFTVKADNKFELSHVLNYPNPFTETTSFFFEHNQPYEDIDVMIQVISPSGKIVKTIDYFFPGSGSLRIGPIYWDGLDDFGDRLGRGVYFYRVKARLASGVTVEKYEKLVILK